MTVLVGHFLIFTIVAILFLLAPLILGRLVRPKLPTPEKDAIYECGEPTIGTSYVQFDLRFYVVALLFIVFDVEVAFFFPWAMVYGGAAQLTDPQLPVAAREEISSKLLGTGDAVPALAGSVINQEAAQQLLWTGLADILVFFGVLLVGFAYVWKRGDLDWVRAMTTQSRHRSADPPTPTPPPQRELETASS